MTRLLTTLFILLIATAGYAQTYTVERVIDGDTIVVTTPEGKSEEVHLIGIDAPESRDNSKARSDAERTGQDLETINKMGQEATDFVKGLIKPGQEVRLEFDVQERDKYGRVLAYCLIWMDDYLELHEKGVISHFVTKDSPFPILLNATIIKSGYAIPMTIPPNVKYADLFKELYEEAREQGRGLWAKGIFP